MRECLILFTKRPRLGRVKTRLVPPLKPEEAVRLYEAFLEDQLRFVAGLRTPDRLLEVSSDEPLPGLGPCSASSIGAEASLQAPGDLGARMRAALTRAAGRGFGASVVLGVDAPTLPAAHVEEAFSRLRGGAEAVLSPALDGGYVLIGVAGAPPDLFSEIAWGGPGVLAATRRRAAEAGIDLEEIEPWYDVDDAAALSRLRADLRGNPTRAPATARVLESFDAGESGVV